MGSTIAIVTPACLTRRDGSSLRVIYQGLGLWRSGFRDFVVYCSGEDPELPFEQRRIETIGPAAFVKPRHFNEALIHAHQNAGLFVKGRLVADLHGWAPLEAGLNVRRHPWRLRPRAHAVLSRWAARRLPKRSERIICASESIATNLHRVHPDLPYPPFVLPNCLDMAEFTPEPCDEAVVGVIGGFRNRWNRAMFWRALRIARLCPEVRFRLVGEADPTQTAAARRVPNVESLGRIDQGDFRSFFKTVSIALLAYDDWCRGGGARLKLLMAAASGLALVATPASLEGFEAPPQTCIGHTDQALAEHVCITLADPARRRHSGQAARQTAIEQHDHLKQAERLIDFYRRMTC